MANTNPYDVSFVDADPYSDVYRIYVPTDLLNTYKVRSIYSSHLDKLYEKVPAPVAVEGLVYNGSFQTGIELPSKYTGSLTGLNAGDYVAVVSPNTNYCWEDGTAGSVNVPWSIAKKELTSGLVTIMIEPTYNGSSQSPFYSVKDGEISIIESSDYTVTGDTAVNAGTYTLTVASTDGGNYFGTVSKTWTMGKKSLSDSMVATSGTYTYTGSQQNVSYTVTDGDPSIIQITDYTVLNDTATDAGSYTLTITASDSGNYSGSATTSWSIGKKALDASMVNVYGTYTYNAETQQLLFIVSDGDPSAIKSSDYSVTGDTAKDAGEYTLTVISSDDGNYSGSVNKSWSIAQKEIIVSNIKATDKSYDKTLTAALDLTDMVITGLAVSDKPNLTVSVSGAYLDAGAGADKTIALSSYSMSGTAAPNYKFAAGCQQAYTFANIAPRAVSASASSVVPSKVYDGNDVWSPTGNDHYVLTDVIEGDAVLLAGKYSFDSSGRDATKVTAYDLYLTGDSASNYSLSSSTYDYASAHIDARQLTVTPVSGQSKDRGTADPVLKYTYCNNVSSETPAFTGALSRDAGEGAGAYEIKAGTLALADNGTFKASNYELYLTPGVTFTIVSNVITKEDFTVDVSDSVYDGTPKTKTVTSNLRLDVDYSVAYADNVNVGKATITITGKGDYSGTLTYEFNIVKLTVNVPSVLYYLETGSKITFSDFPTGDRYTETTGKEKAGTAACTYQYKLALNDAANTQWSDASFNGDYFVYITVEYKAYYEEEELIASLDFFEKGVRAESEISLTRSKDVSSQTKELIKGEGGNIVYSYDVKIVIDGKEIQPEGKVKMTLLIPGEVRGQSYRIFHVHDGTYQKVEYTEDGDYVSLTVGEFSEFVFVRDAGASNTVLYIVLGVAGGLALILVAIFLIRKH